MMSTQIHSSDLFEQALFRILTVRNECCSCTEKILSASYSAEEKSARLFLDAVAGAAAPDSPFTVYYPASNQAELIVRQSAPQSFWSERSVFAAECAPIVQNLERTVNFLSYLLDNGYAETVPFEKEYIPAPPESIGIEWRSFRTISKTLIYDLCFFRQTAVIIKTAEFVRT